MPSTDLMQQLPITREVEATPPAPSDVEPRTERHDWLFVGYPWAWEVKQNLPAEALYAADLAEIPRTVAALAARDKAQAQYPYIFLAPLLASAFEDAVVTARLVEDRADDLFGRCWDSLIDLTVPMWVCVLHPHGCPGDCESLDTKYNPLILPDAAIPDRLAVLERDGPWDWKRDLGPVRVILGELLAAWRRYQFKARLHRAEKFPGGWTVLTDRGGTTVPNDQHPSIYTTPRGFRLVSLKAYRDLAEQYVLPVAADRLVDFISHFHEEHNEDCDALPSKRKIDAFLKSEGIRDPVPVAAVAPTAAALLAGRGMTESPSPLAVLPYLAWGGRVTLLAAREKDGKSTLVGGAVAALTRGAPWLGEPCDPVGPVLWLHEEAPDDVIGRLQQFGADLARVHLLQLPQADAARALTANVTRLRPRVIIVDSLVRFAAGRVTDPTRATQWEPIMSEFLGLAQKSGAAIVVLHHAGKKDGEYRDSTEIGAGVDMLIQMPGGLKGNRQRLEGKGRIVGVAPYTITVELVGTAHQLVAATSRARAITAPATTTSLGERDRAVLGTLLGTMGFSEWCKASGLKSKKTFNGIVKRLQAVEAVVKTKDGRYRTS